MNDELNRLKSEAEAVDAEFIPAGEASSAEQAAAGMDYKAEALGLINFAAALFIPLFPSLEPIYTEPTRENLANVSAPLMEKYGWSMGSFFEKWGAEINFAMLAIPLSIATYRAIEADISASQKTEKPQQQGHSMGHPFMDKAEEQAL